MGTSLGTLTGAQKAELAGPAGAPPPGVIPSANAPSLWNASIAINVICLTISVVSVAGRVFARGFIARSLHIEDGFIVLALLAQIANVVFGEFTNVHGIVKHMWDITLYDFVVADHWVGYSALMYSVAIFFIKLALPLQFLRIFVPDRRLTPAMWIACWIVIVFNGLFYFINIFVQAFSCSPRDKAWNIFVTTGHCLSVEAEFKATGIYNVVSDWALLFLPLLGISRLHMKLRMKLAIGAIFGAGLLACIASIIRTVYTWILYRSTDFSWHICIVGLASEIEMSIGILVFCLPVAPQIARFFRDKFSPSKSMSEPPSQRRLVQEHGSGSTEKTDPQTSGARTQYSNEDINEPLSHV